MDDSKSGPESVYEGPKLPRSIFKWIAVQDAEHEENRNKPPAEEGITAEEVAIKYGMPADIFIDHMAEEIEEAESCQTLPFTLLLVISYAMMVITHDNAVVFNSVEDSIDFDIDNNANFAFSSPYIGHKNYHDVNSHADFWSWMIQGFVPLIFQQSHGFSEGLNMSHPLVVAAQEDFPRTSQKRGMLLNYNRIVGGIRMTQERSNEDCFQSPQTEPLREFYDKKCVGGLGYELAPDMWVARYTTNPERVRWLYIHDDIDVVLDQLAEMETSFWLDPQTRKVEIGLPVYNAEYGIHCLVTINFFFSRGGHIWKKIIPLSTFAVMHDGWISVLPDVTWLGCILYVLVVEATEIYNLVLAKGWRSVCKEYVGFWNTVDWISMFGAMVICIVFVMHIRNVDRLNKALIELGITDEVSNRDAFRAETEDHMNILQESVNFAQGFKTMLAIYPMVIVLRLFKAFAAQPRLAVVTKTLSQSGVDLVHFLLVFMSVFITYAISGVLLFGREIDGFTTFPRAINTSFRCMMGDFDWEELSVVGRMDAGIWFWTFEVVVVLLMLNMLMAIVMDAYGEVKANVGNADTLWGETKQAWHRLQGTRSGKHVPMESVLTEVRRRYNEMRRLKVDKDAKHEEKKAEENDEKKEGGKKADEKAPDVEEGELKDGARLVTIDFLKRVVDGLRTTQSIELIKEAIEAYYESAKEGVSEEELLTLIRKVNYRTKKMKKTLAGWVDGPTIEEQIQMKIFSEELVWLRTELGHAASHIGMDPTEGEEDGESENSEEEDGKVGHRDAGVGELQVFKSLDQVSKGLMVYVLESSSEVLKACHQAGINTQNDHMREQAIGLAVEVLDKDGHDDTCKCRVPGVGDLWFSIKALAQAKDDQEMVKKQFAETLRKQGREDGEEDEELPDIEELEREVEDLEAELASGKSTMSEAMMAVSELEYRLHQAHEERHDGTRSFKAMKQRLQAVQKESKELRGKIQETEQKIHTVSASRNEYFDLVRKMVEDNTDLKTKIDDFDRHAETLSTEARTAEAHQKMVQLALEAKLDEAIAERSRVEASTIRAYQMLAQHVEDIAQALEQASASIVRGGPSRDPFSAGVAKELKTLRDGARTMLVEGAPGFTGDPDHVDPDPHTFRPPPRSSGFQAPPGGTGGMNGHRGMNGHGVNGHNHINGSNGFARQEVMDDEYETDEEFDPDLP
eukprot:gnl/MRDRNA2_/MRDRNA2_90744_c0_seq1.p1 gnl/MRDRNA2_/MRDRNA2_90744_c0~~gnl/MRDRNA2_/MRDRNA2_90744_c0_seq1.p1  ORF type:complete len:1192 (-),score=272.92 gnl/MRDRNA2_/MRDRNA2_90744_c0_seq1:74-3649(-)